MSDAFYAAAPMDAHLNCFHLGTAPKQTCYQCRLRKVRCDGVLSGCRSCQRLKFRCSFRNRNDIDAMTKASFTASVDAPQKRRVRQACLGCRKHKIRCSGESPQCSSCRRRDIPCSYSTTGKRKLYRPIHCEERCETTQGDFLTNQNAQETPETTQYSKTPAIPTTDIASNVDTFLKMLYPLPSYTFFHPATVRRRCSEGKLDESLILAVCALVEFHGWSHKQTQGSSAHWIQAAEQIIWQQVERPTVSRLQALLLIIRYRMETGRFQRAFMLAAVAARFAAAMRLIHEHPELNIVAREVRRRLVWSLKLIERYFSIGLPEFEVCPYETIYCELPCREDEFNGVQHCRSAVTDERSEGGAYRLSMRLELMRRDIMRLSRGIALCEETFPILPNIVNDFERELATVAEQIPGGIDLTRSQLSDLADDTWLPRHVLLYLSWHQCHCDLYRLFLPGYQEAAPQAVLQGLDNAYTAVAEQQCLHHAAAIIRVITSLNENSTKSPLLEFDTAICVYHAIRLTFFISWCGCGPDRPSTEFATSRADLCLAALRRFFPSSVLVKPIIKEIEQCTEAFRAQGAHAWPLMSPAFTQGRQNPTYQLSTAAKARQRLAIHALLLQVESYNDDYDEETHARPEYVLPGQQCMDFVGTGVAQSLTQEHTPSSIAGASELEGSTESFPGDVISPPNSDSSQSLMNRTNSNLVRTWDSYEDSAELPNDSQFPLLPRGKLSTVWF